MIKNHLKIIFFSLAVNIVVSSKILPMVASAALPDERALRITELIQSLVNNADPAHLERVFNSLPDLETKQSVKKKLIQKFLFQLSLADPLLFRSTKDYHAALARGNNPWADAGANVKQIIDGGNNQWAVELWDRSIHLIKSEGTHTVLIENGKFLAWSDYGNLALIQPSDTDDLYLFHLARTSEQRSSLMGFHARVETAASVATVADTKINIAKVNDAVFSHDNAYLLTGSSNGMLYCWNLIHNTVQKICKLDHAINSVALSPCNKWLVITTENFDAYLYYIENKGELDHPLHFELKYSHVSLSKVIAVAFGNPLRDTKQRIFLGMEDGSLWIGELQIDGKIEWKVIKEHTKAIHIICPNPTGSHIIICSDDESIRLLSFDDSNSTVKSSRYSIGKINALKFITDTAFLICTDNEATVSKATLSDINHIPFTNKSFESNGLFVNRARDVLLNFNARGTVEQCNIADYTNLSFEAMVRKIVSGEGQLRRADRLMMLCNYVGKPIFPFAVLPVTEFLRDALRRIFGANNSNVEIANFGIWMVTNEILFRYLVDTFLKSKISPMSLNISNWYANESDPIKREIRIIAPILTTCALIWVLHCSVHRV